MQTKIGFTCGTFDLFHAGHVVMLREAKQNCDYLIVGIQMDPSIDRPTKNKPVQSIIERQIQVKGCRYVDETIVYTTEEELNILLKTLPIDVRILGEEYRYIEYTGKELQTCVVYNKRQHTFSSTALRDRVCKAENTKTI
jgi:glycerol-3-phosphate cytidylyltransferase